MPRPAAPRPASSRGPGSTRSSCAATRPPPSGGWPRPSGATEAIPGRATAARSSRKGGSTTRRSGAPHGARRGGPRAPARGGRGAAARRPGRPRAVAGPGDRGRARPGAAAPRAGARGADTVGPRAAAAALGDTAAGGPPAGRGRRAHRLTLAGPYGALHALDLDTPFAPEEGPLPASAPAPAGLPAAPRGPRHAGWPVLLDGEPAGGDLHYLAAEVTLASGGDYLLASRGAVSLRAFLDGVPVAERRAHAGFLPLSQLVPLRLAAGTHRLLLKLARGEGGVARRGLAGARRRRALGRRLSPPRRGRRPPRSAPEPCRRRSPARLERARALEPRRARYRAAGGSPGRRRRRSRGGQGAGGGGARARPGLGGAARAAGGAAAGRPDAGRAHRPLASGGRPRPGPRGRPRRTPPPGWPAPSWRAPATGSTTRRRSSTGSPRWTRPGPGRSSPGRGSRRRAGSPSAPSALPRRRAAATAACAALSLLLDLASQRDAVARQDELVAALARCPGGRERVVTHRRRRGDLPGALALASEIVRADPARLTRGSCASDLLAANGDPRAAADDLAELARTWPREPRLPRRRAEYLDDAGDAKAAQAARELALLLDASDLGLRRALAVEDGHEPLDELDEDGTRALAAYRAGGKSRATSSVTVLDLGAIQPIPGAPTPSASTAWWRRATSARSTGWARWPSPRGAQLIEARTVKKDGRVLEPEQPLGDKRTLSLTGLEPGDFAEWAWLRTVPARGPGRARVHRRCVLLPGRGAALALGLHGGGGGGPGPLRRRPPPSCAPVKVGARPADGAGGAGGRPARAAGAECARRGGARTVRAGRRRRRHRGARPRHRRRCARAVPAQPGGARAGGGDRRVRPGRAARDGRPAARRLPRGCTSSSSARVERSASRRARCSRAAGAAGRCS